MKKRKISDYSEAELERILAEIKASRSPAWPECCICEKEYHPGEAHWLVEACDACGTKLLEAKLRAIRGRDTRENRQRLMQALSNLEKLSTIHKHRKAI